MLSTLSCTCFVMSFVLTFQSPVARSTNSIDNYECDMFMAPSIMPGAGRGIFTAKDLTPHDQFDDAPTVSVPNEQTEHWSLHDYVYGSELPDRSLVIFGPAMLYNHQSADYKNVVHRWSDDDINSKAESAPYATSTNIYFAPLENISSGQELFSYYGERWFNLRGIRQVHVDDSSEFKHSLEYLNNNGICLSHIYVSQSKIPGAGKGLFAKKSFKKGEVISVSPVLVLPRHELIEISDETVLLNYCMTSDSDVDVALLPIGLPVIANHATRDEFNMNIRWYDETLKESDPVKLFKSLNAPMDFEYYASRDIERGEELTIYYGEAWENKWKEFSSLDPDAGEMFRHSIELSDDLIPFSWRSLKCFGIQCNEFMNDTVKHDNTNINSCELYLAPSTLGSGKGVFTGRPLRSNWADTVEVSPTLTIPHHVVESWSLNDFVYGSSEPDRSLIIFGAAMIYNHMPEQRRNVIHLWTETKLRCALESTPYATSTGILFASERAVNFGEELFSYYGEDWFDERGLDESSGFIPYSATRRSVAYLETNGVCISNVVVAPSTIPGAGKGLFAKKNFQRGDTVYVSPVLALPKREVIRSANESVLMNYCFISELDTDVALLPIGLSAVMNHQPEDSANIIYRWHDSTILNQDPTVLFATKDAPFEFEYVATRDIMKGEELTISYGKQWEQAWSGYESSDKTDNVFRQAIQISNQLIPDSWISISCFGMLCNQHMNESINFESEDDECAVFMAESTLPGVGRGIFTNRYLKAGSLVEQSPTLSVPEYNHKSWSLSQYTFADVPGRVILSFGVAMLYNHNINKYKNVNNVLSDDNNRKIFSGNAPFTTDRDISYVGRRLVKPGDELMISYGDDWFAPQNIILQKIDEKREAPSQSFTCPRSW